MDTFATTATVEDPGQVRVAGVPFATGTEVAVTISPKQGSAEAPAQAALDESTASTKQPAYDELAEVVTACRAPNWDAHGSAAVQPETVRQAHRFLQALPPGY